MNSSWTFLWSPSQKWKCLIVEGPKVFVDFDLNLVSILSAYKLHFWWIHCWHLSVLLLLRANCIKIENTNYFNTTKPKQISGWGFFSIVTMLDQTFFLLISIISIQLEKVSVTGIWERDTGRNFILSLID